MTVYALGGILLFMGGLAYMAVPLYKAYCRATGYGGSPVYGIRKTENLNSKDNNFGLDFFSKDPSSELNNALENPKIITVTFDTNVSSGSQMEFTPITKTLDVVVGELSMAIFKVTNNGSTTTGVATYNVSPAEAGVHLTKIQCFCFDEQIFFGKEVVEMPVLFYINENFLTDLHMLNVDSIHLSYTLHDVLSVSTDELFDLFSMLFGF